MAPFRPQRRAAEEEEEEEELDEEDDEEEEVLLAPGSRAPGDAPRAIINVPGMSAALEDFAWPASVAWVDTLVVQVRRLCLPAHPTSPQALRGLRLHAHAFVASAACSVAAAGPGSVCKRDLHLRRRPAAWRLLTPHRLAGRRRAAARHFPPVPHDTTRGV
jgi:hypothetical protein